MTDAVRLVAAEVRIGGGRILGPLDLTIADGERWVLLGPNGSGKTTALSLMGARRQPSTGEVIVLGCRLGRTDVRRLRHRIGHVSHRVTEELDDGLTVVDTVLTGRDGTLVRWWRSFDGPERDEAHRLLREVGCGSLADRALSTCSLGERQRILLARALFGPHQLLLFDEPAAGLDLPARERLLGAMGAVTPDRTTVLATHHLEEIPASTSHAALLRAGSLVASGAIEDVLTAERLGVCFDEPIEVAHSNGRWTARART